MTARAQRHSDAKSAEYAAAYRARHPGRGAEAMRRFRLNHPARAAEQGRRSKKNTPGRVRAESALQRAREAGRAPIWVSQFRSAFVEIYGNRPDGFEVDHIIPLVAKNVCGLHVPWNLQYLTREDNVKKSMMGEGNPNSKLTREQVIVIRELITIGDLSYRLIGLCFSVSISTIYLIAKGRTWL